MAFYISYFLYLCPMNIKAITIYIILICGSTFSALAQNLQERGYWDAGFNWGFFMGNKNTANFYNGTGENNINKVIGNFYIMEDVVRELDHTYDTAEIELPGDMRYKPAMSVGFHGTYYLGSRLALFFQGTFARLKTADIFLIHYNDIQFPTNTVESYAICPIYGVEDRTIVDIGVRRSYPIGDITDFFFETGFSFTNTIVKEHKIEVGTLSYSIKNTYKNNQYVPNSNYQTYDIRQGGIGWGTMISLGTTFYFSEQLSVQLVATGYYNTTKLPGYEQFRLQLNPAARLIFQNL